MYTVGTTFFMTFFDNIGFIINRVETIFAPYY